MNTEATITDAVDYYEAALNSYNEFVEKTQRYKEILNLAEQDLINRMVDNEVGSITVRGKRYSTEVKPKISPASGRGDEVVEWIVAHGGGDLVRPSMHHARRDAFLRDVCINDDGLIDLPADLVDLVRVYDAPRLKVTGN